MLTVSSLSKFSYTLVDGAGEACATVRMPTRPAMARHSALQLGANGFVEIDAGGATYRVEYETFDAGALAPRGYRFFLMQGDRTVATAEGQPGRPRTWRLSGDGLDARLVERSRMLGMRFELLGLDGCTGEIRETTRFLALRRRFEIDLPTGIPTALQAFAFFLAVNATYR